MHITFLFYNGMTALDAIGPHEILSRLPNAVVHRVALKAGPIQTCSGLVLNAEETLSDVIKTDVLVIPGAGNATALRQYPDILAWVAKIHETTTWTTSVCTGSLILGAAGVLAGLPATTHWAVMDRLALFNAIPTHQRVVEAGKIITAAGVSAGIDMALWLAAKIAGQPVAETLQLGLEYDPEPPFHSGSPDKARPEILNGLRARLMTRFENLDFE
jgi:transcriptional regulator GlxA family with amidase domain